MHPTFTFSTRNFLTDETKANNTRWQCIEMISLSHKKPILLRRHGSFSSDTMEETDLKKRKKKRKKLKFFTFKLLFVNYFSNYFL